MPIVTLLPCEQVDYFIFISIFFVFLFGIVGKLSDQIVTVDGLRITVGSITEMILCTYFGTILKALFPLPCSW